MQSNFLSLKKNLSLLRGHNGFWRYFTNTTWSIGARVVSQIISFIVTAYIVRYLGPSNYGQLSYAVSFVGIFGVLSTLGIDSILYRSLIEHKDKHREYLGSALVLKLIAGTATYLITVLFAFYLVPHEDISHWLIWIISFTYIVNAFNIITFEFQAHVDQKIVSIISMCVLAVLSVLKLVVVFANQGIIYFALILVLESILYICTYIFFRRKYFPIWQWKPDISIMKKLLVSSWPLLLSGSFTVIYTRVDQIIIKNMLDNASVGIYDSAVKIAESWAVIPAVIVSSLFPSIINARMTSFKSYKNRTLALALLMGGVAIAISIVISIFARPIMHILYGPEYISGVSVLRVYCWASVWLSIGHVTYYYLISENKVKLLFYTSFLAMVLNVVLNIWLIPKYGILGATWATFFSYIIIALPLIHLIRRKNIEKSSD